MMATESTPWCARFDGLTDHEAIKRRAISIPPPLCGLDELSVEEACFQVEEALRHVFYPTQQCLLVLTKWVERARAHSFRHYKSAKDFLGFVHAEDPGFPKMAFPMCLTGLAGAGKSQLILAYSRLMAGCLKVKLDKDYSPFVIRSAWYLIVGANVSQRHLFATMSGLSESRKDLYQACRNKAYRDGVPIILADEFQFATQSQDANAMVTKMLLTLAYLGVPSVFAANYSLIGRLLKRPQEDQDRVLSNIVCIHPENIAGEDWEHVVKSQMSVVPGVFNSNKDIIHALGACTGGIPRYLAKLLVVAYRIGRTNKRMVGVKEIESAYAHDDFAGFRRSVEALLLRDQGRGRDASRSSMICPVELNSERLINSNSVNKKIRDEQVADAKIRSALTAGEAGALEDIDGKKDRVIKASKSKRQIVTIEKLSEDTATYMKKILGA